MVPTDYIDTWYRRTLHGDTPRPPLEGHVQTSVAIVGGGLAGLTCAVELANKGLNVALIEAHRIGWGASGRNGGSVSPAWSATDRSLQRRVGRDHADELFRLSLEGMNMVKHYASTLAGDAAHIVHGHLKVSLYDNASAFQRTRDEQAMRFGRTLRYLDRTQLHELVQSPRYYQGLYADDGFHFHPLNYCHALARECERLGVSIYENTRVTTIQTQAGQRRLHTHTGHITADTVVICTGGYTDTLIPTLHRAYLPIATYVMLSEPLGAVLHDAIRTPAAIGDNRRAGNYYRIVGGDRLQWGGHITTRTSDPSNITHILRRELEACYPQLRGIAIDTTWSGLMAYARHMMPQIGKLDEGLWHCTAFGGHGVNTTAIGARTVAEGITNESDRYKLFAPFGLLWNGGVAGKAAVQLTYWRYQLMDWYKERQSQR